MKQSLRKKEREREKEIILDDSHVYFIPIKTKKFTDNSLIEWKFREPNLIETAKII